MLKLSLKKETLKLNHLSTDNPGDERQGTYTTKLKVEPQTTKRGLSRSNSSPNIAKMVEEEIAAEKKHVPSIDRGNKPLKR